MKNLKHQTKSSIGIRSNHSTLFYTACGMTGILLLTTIISGIVLSSSSTHADSTATSNVSVTVDTACTLSASGGGTYSATITPGTTSEITGSTLSTVCNDPNGYAIYAIGYGNDSYDTPTNTQMIGANGIGNIVTGTATTGNTSNWAMKVNPTSGSNPTIANNFNNYHVIPSEYTQIAKYTSSTSSSTATGASIDSKYQVYITSAQIAGTYTGKVKYTMVHPNTAPAPTPPPGLCTDTATCMQTSTACDTTLTDGRDGATYTTATIAGSCWMTQNLRFQGTDLKVGESDVTSNITMTYGQLTSGSSVTEPRIATGSTTDYGTYYNFCAASAGEVCNDTTQQDATRSVCPAGWKLPTQAQLNALPSKDSHFIASSGLAGAYFISSLSGAGTSGFWWASTAGSAEYQYHLNYNSDYDDWYVDDFGTYKFQGESVRCVRDS